MTEEMILNSVRENKKRIKKALLDRDMTQVELSKLLDVNPQVLNRAVQGDMSPRSLEIRHSINRVLGL
ncbi:helix-turn-helix transcriptional regulator [Lactobacillus sp. LC28-10]|uniref:Helix-turn-helix transcriptional regulator n=1 Tax=Secundilactobacillus angelensis TaxID=2722706 RepID=A0ABX1L3K5_9LACO|nr:helix-turn-helix transcriptional regulator [Secundilactobacillus angelensis]MCH5463225.1 helix-turn-helix domain-containing protein [Secundilactobacillus angelensis]NLR19628.1 helix-turn-helix transcriptional regulator [Secundilactobacillus angelensis]